MQGRITDLIAIARDTDEDCVGFDLNHILAGDLILSCVKKVYMVRLCKYRDIFGSPNRGVHSWRFMGVAVVDAGLTLVAGWVISYYSRLNFLLCLGGLFLVGVFLHWLFCVDTQVARWLRLAT
jgi:hypothetical protein